MTQPIDPSLVNSLNLLRMHIQWAERQFGNMLPHVVLACSGGSDEHWQIWNSQELYESAHTGDECFPAFVLPPDCSSISAHPDGSFAPRPTE